LRSAAVLALGAVLAIGAAGCDASSSGGGGGAGGSSGDAAEASRQLESLIVASAGSMSGYSRDRFPHWRDAGENCDVRDTVLGRDGEDIQLKGCNVTGGSWFSVYDDKVYDKPTEVDIDHMVPLANAWRSGADEWDDQRRGDFANDLDNPQLIAVSATTNRSKGDQDPSQWKPPNRGYWCTYAQSWIAVKHAWQLSITKAEKSALQDMLGTCA
jgi:Protein of unknown function (DUF1524)